VSSRLARCPRALPPAALADPAGPVVRPPSLRPPPPATVGRDRTRDAVRATLGPPRGAALAGSPPRRTLAVARRPAHQVETIVGICSTGASCAQRPRPSPTTRSAAGHSHHRPCARQLAIATNDHALGRWPQPPPTTPVAVDQLSGSLLTSSPGSLLASVEVALDTHCVASADAATTNVFRHSVHRRRISGACADDGVRPQVDHDPAADGTLIRWRGGSLSRREVDPD
jgi:hypothetical protein